MKTTINGETAWWHVVGSKVTKDTTVAKNSNGWWYLEGGKVNFGYNGTVTADEKNYTVKNGKVNK